MFKNVNDEDFRRKKYYKIVNSLLGLDAIHHYKLGTNKYDYNKYKLEFIINGDGIYFTNIENIFAYLDYGPILLCLTIPKDARVLYNPERLSITNHETPAWCADKIFVESMSLLTDPSIINALINRGANVSTDNYHLYKWACKYNLDVFNSLINKFGKDSVLKEIYKYYGFYDDKSDMLDI